MFFENSYLDFATLSAVVAAFVSVMGNAFNIHPKYRAVLAIFVGMVLVFMPPWLMEKSVMALLIGLTASGVYTQVKKRDYFTNERQDNINERQDNIKTGEKAAEAPGGPSSNHPPKVNGPEDV